MASALAASHKGMAPRTVPAHSNAARTAFNQQFVRPVVYVNANSGGYRPQTGRRPQMPQADQDASADPNLINYRPPRDNSQGGGGGYENRNSNNGGRPNYNQGSRRQYNNNRDGQFNRDGQNNRGGDSDRSYRPRRQFDSEGRPIQAGGESEQRSFQRLTPEQKQVQQQMNQLVRDAKGWRGIGRLLMEHGSSLDNENITTLMMKMTKEPRPSHPDDAADWDSVLGQLLGFVLVLAPTYKTKNLGRTMYSLGKLQLYSPDVLTALMERSADQMGNFTGNELASVLRACNQLNHPPPEAFLKQFFMRTPAKQFPTIKLLDLSAIIQAMTGLGITHLAPQEFLAELYNTLAAKCKNLPKTEEEAKEISGLQQKQAEQSPEAAGDASRAASPETPATSQAARPQRKKYNNRDQERNPNDLGLGEYVDLVMGVATLTQACNIQPSVELVDSMITSQAWRMNMFKLNMDLINRILWALTNFQARPSPVWFETVYFSMHRRDRDWKAQDISTACLYLARYLQIPAPPIFCTKLSKHMSGQLEAYGPENLSNALYLLAFNRWRPAEERWLDGILIYLKAAMSTTACSLQAYESIYNSLPALGQGYRLDEVKTEAANRYNAAVAAQQAEMQQQQQQQEPAATY